MFRIFILTCLLALPIHAQNALSGPEFDALTQGRTFIFSVDGSDYGGERYLPGHVVEWSFLDGDCKRGTWVADAGKICFTYEDAPDTSCWIFRLSPGGMSARLADPADETRTYQASESIEPLFCLGPKTGV